MEKNNSHEPTPGSKWSNLQPKSILAKIKNDKRLSIALAAIGITAVLGLVHLWTNSPQPKQQNTQQTNTQPTPPAPQPQEKTPPPIRWDFDFQANTWRVMAGIPPTCPDPVFTHSPVDLSKATSIGFPGQYRSKDYKPHGLFAFANSKAEDIKVQMPMDAKLVRLVRYNESNELQYLLVFENDCGIAFRFDHLFTLAPAFQAVAETTPPPKTDDTTSMPLPNPVAFKAGDVVATAVGHPARNNIGFDFGVYDYRKQNDISKNEQWRALHTQFAANDWYGICWFNLLPGKDAERAAQLSRIWVNTRLAPRFTSDYCENADYTTLEINGGRPTDY